MNEETPPRWKTILSMIDTYTEKAIDASIDHIGCTILCILVASALLIILIMGLVAYAEYAHRNQHCVHATREYVMIGKVLTPEDVCDTWENN